MNIVHKFYDKLSDKSTSMSPVAFTLMVSGFYLALLTLWGAITIAFITWGVPFIIKLNQVKQDACDGLSFAFILTWFCLLFVAIHDIINNTLIGKPIKALMNTNNWFLYYFVRNPLLFITWPFTSIIIPYSFVFAIIFWPFGLVLAGFHWTGIFLGIVLFMALRRR